MDINQIVEVNQEAIEPVEYFKVLKGKLTESQEEELQTSLNFIAEQILAAKKVGQENFLRKLAFTGQSMLKEQLLKTFGYDKFVLKEDIKLFIDKVEPKNSIKIIELSRYPRAIPLENLEIIAKVKDLDVFDDFVVVFTDLTENNYQTESEKEFVQRNRDPIVFGFFEDSVTGVQHDRFYFITDWEDEYCDLTFSKLINKMSESGFKNPEKTIGKDAKYLQELTMSALEETKTLDKRIGQKEAPKPKPWYKKILKF